MIRHPALAREPLVVKICGLRSPAQAVAAGRAGADLLGFNFAPVSKRRVAPEVALAAVEACAAALAAPPAMVGVFVNQPPAEVAGTARRCRLDALQLSGDETADACRALAAETGLPVIKAVRLGLGQEADAVDGYVDGGGVAALLVDAPVVGTWGGTGQGWEWSLAAPLARRVRVLLAGGLTADTVGAAARAVRPWGVDVASGVEVAGQPDAGKVAAFVARARSGAGTGDWHENE